jgi:capsular polysaccharide biosynthesis protein
MIVEDLNCVPDQYVFHVADEHGREIRIFKLADVQAVGQTHYPTVALYSRGQIFNPIRERVMSLPDVAPRLLERPSVSKVHRIEVTPVFFFVYNVDNYYHFLYDSLPYLITYQHLRKVVPHLKLLINTANRQQRKLSQFVTEFLSLLDIQESDLVLFDDDTLYRDVYISSSYTHDNQSNDPPRQEVYDLYRSLGDKVECDPKLPRKIYVSRRSYKHAKYDNIGTNYTTRRNFVNESEFVSLLESQGYTEVFTELLTTREKIALFKGCTHVIGPIGGGLCNVLFSSPQTKLISIVSPHFLDINKRFCYSFANVDVGYFYGTQHIETSEHKRYMRVRIKPLNLIGEIADVLKDDVCVAYSDDPVAGWNAQHTYNIKVVPKDAVEILDPGLNSAWTMDLTKFAETVDV